PHGARRDGARARPRAAGRARAARQRARRPGVRRAAGHDRRVPPHPRGGRVVSWRRLRTLLPREVRAPPRHPFTVTIMVTVPLAALLTFGFTLSTEVHHLALGVHDASGTPASRRLVADLAASDTFDPRPFATREALDRAIVSGDIAVAIVIPPDFDRRLREAEGGAPPTVQAIYDGGEAVLAGNAEGFLRGLVAASGTALAGPHAVPGGVQVVTRALFNPKLDGKLFMVSGTFGFVLSFLTTLITAVSIVNERLTGTF